MKRRTLDGVTEIAAFSFQNCANLKSVIIPDTVTCIGAWSFSGCVNLERLTIPTNAVIEAWAFDNCPELTVLFVVVG